MKTIQKQSRANKQAKAKQDLKFYCLKILHQNKLLVIRKPGGRSQSGSLRGREDPGELIRKESLVELAGRQLISGQGREELEKNLL